MFASIKVGGFATVRSFESNEQLVEELAWYIAYLLATAIEERGGATLAVPGGSTPVKLFQALSTRPLKWSRVTVTLVDERWVDSNHPDSNARLVKENLLCNEAAAAHFCELYTETESAHLGEGVIEKQLSKLNWPLDVVLLGMGEDGHVASLFPNAEELDASLDLQRSNRCAAITPPDAPHLRMTLTLSALLNSRKRILYTVGDRKWDVLHKAARSSTARRYPVAALLHRRDHPIEIFHAESQ